MPGDPAVAGSELLLAAQPVISVPTIALDGAGDGVSLIGGSEQHQRFFSGPYQRRVIPVSGHNLPQESPQEFADAIRELL